MRRGDTRRRAPNEGQLLTAPATCPLAKTCAWMLGVTVSHMLRLEFATSRLFAHRKVASNELVCYICAPHDDLGMKGTIQVVP